MPHVDEPSYTTLEESQQVEIRRYDAMVVASTEVEGRFSRALNEGFRRLAGYIFGGSRPRERLEMTAPVTTQLSGERIAMTAPVQARGSGHRWTVTFVMPPGRTLGDLPAPMDARVRLHEVPPRTVAVLRFGGWATERAVGKRTRQLVEWLVERDLPPVGEVSIAQYDPPWRLPFLRRNEVMIEVTPRAGRR